MRDGRHPDRKNPREKKTDQIGKPDEAAVGHKGGAEIDIDQREKEPAGAK